MSDFPPRPAQARAPTSLDVMGGLSDYSGGLCLQWPLEIATICRVTPQNETVIIARTQGPRGAGESSHVALALDEFALLDATKARALFRGESAWALYVVGALIVLRTEIGWASPRGLIIEIESSVPHAAGVAASAAIEVAVLTAVNRAFGLELDGHQIARLAQKLENEIVGAPYEITRPLTAALGRKDHLLQLKCQPDVVEGFVAPPAGIEFWGLDSGVQHSGGDAYKRSRCAAMMGRAILARLLPAAMRGPDGALYLANIGADVWRALRMQMPAMLKGADFLRDYSPLDSATTVDSETIYPVRLATEHPIYEADRVLRFARLLRQMDENSRARAALGRAAGELMIQSHFSYDHRCGLGSAETDLLVELARGVGVKSGIYGAKITGNGAGGAVAIMADRHINPNLDGAIEEIAARYAGQSGRTPQIFRGSSDGANVLF